MTELQVRTRRRFFPSWPDLMIGLRILRARIRADRTTQQAAAMTYNTLFSLLPVLVLALVILSLVLSSKQIAGTEHTLISKLGLSAVHNRGSAGAKSSLFVDTIIKQIDKMRNVLRNPGTGVVGFATLLWGAISLMNVIEAAFDHIYRVRNRRSWGRRVTLYWCVLSLGPLGVVGSLIITAKLVSIAAGVPRLAILIGPANFLVGYLPDFIIIFIFYKLIPNTHVAWKSAAVGALAATLLWELGKIGFGFYVAYAAGYGKWYGNLGLIPLFMLWVYLTWTFLLIGLETAFIHQHFPLLKRRYGRRSDASDLYLADPRWVLPLAALLVMQFRKGSGVTFDGASEELALPLDTTARLLNLLSEAKLVHEVGDNPSMYVLAKAPENITIAELLFVAHHCVQSPADQRVSAGGLLGGMVDLPVIRELNDMESQWAQAHTLADITPASALPAADPSAAKLSAAARGVPA
ncbi:MAG: YhjD/YihY/BrkB family envelope integrity protein [Phycisphaerae bacterium]